MIDTIVVSNELNKNIYYLSPDSNDYKVGDIVVFEDNNDLFIGTVIKEKYQENKKNLVLPLNKVKRVALKDDLKKYEENIKLATKAIKDAVKFTKELDLEMRFVDAYYNLNKSQLVFEFVAESRIDFRELAKKLAAKYKTRIELRQIGVRDKARKIGGLGPCGLFLCCNSFLTDFNSVSINMAKNQNLALNPTKINGVCGRLYCCLDYENDVYTEMKKNLPTVGSIVKTKGGEGKVVSVDILKRKYKVDLGEKGLVEVEENGKNK